MAISHGDPITPPSPDARFFLGPDKPLHRQYEALRAYFVAGLSSPEVAKLFGYSPGAFRVLCTRFRQEPNKADRFFRDVQRGPQTSPLRDRLRDTVPSCSSIEVNALTAIGSHVLPERVNEPAESSRGGSNQLAGRDSRLRTEVRAHRVCLARR